MVGKTTGTYREESIVGGKSNRGRMKKIGVTEMERKRGKKINEEITE